MKYRKTLALAIFTLFALIFTSYGLFAYTSVDTSRECSLTLTYRAEKSGASVSLYRVAGIDSYARYTLTDAFSPSLVAISDDMSASDWNTASTLLYNYAVSNALSATAASSVSALGKASFSKLSCGLYLVVTTDSLTGKTVWRNAPFLISLPNLDGESGEWVWDVAASPKTESFINTQLIDISVVKIWNDDGGSKRPTSITVNLNRNGIAYQTATLSSVNYWRYTWTDLDQSYLWTVTESGVPSGYSASYSGTMTAVVITNTYNPPETTTAVTTTHETTTRETTARETTTRETTTREITVPETTHETTEWRPVTTETPETVVSETSSPAAADDSLLNDLFSNNPGETLTLGDGSSLPQTGTLNWPVPVMAAGGLTLFAAGWTLNRRQNKSDKDKTKSGKHKRG